MELLIPKIEIKSLTSKELKIYKHLNQSPYGMVLATQVTAKLKKNTNESGGLYLSHRDYCGLGIYLHRNRFCMGIVNDGRGPYPTIISFDHSYEFTSWLACENDQSMALYGEHFNNQTISKIRLEWYLDNAYSPIWNAYCTYYIRENNRSAE